MVDYIFEDNKVPEVRKMPLISSDIIYRARQKLKIDGYDPYFLNDLHLETAPKSSEIPIDIVSLHNGVLTGLSNFRATEDPNVSKDPSQLWLIWKYLRVSYTVTVNFEGLQFDGQMDMRVGRLLMFIQLANHASKSIYIEMSKVKELETKVEKLHAFSEDFRTAVCLESEAKIRQLLNGHIRTILLSYFKDAADNNSVDNELSPLSIPEEYYEVFFR